jgi:hypothetical protein
MIGNHAVIIGSLTEMIGNRTRAVIIGSLTEMIGNHTQ